MERRWLETFPLNPLLTANNILPNIVPPEVVDPNVAAHPFPQPLDLFIGMEFETVEEDAFLIDDVSDIVAMRQPINEFPPFDFEVK